MTPETIVVALLTAWGAAGWLAWGYEHSARTEEESVYEALYLASESDVLRD